MPPTNSSESVEDSLSSPDPHPSSPLTIEEIAQIPLFSEIAAHHLEKIACILKRRDFLDGDILLEERDRGDAILFILSGSVKIELRGDEKSCIVGFCSAGEMLGEVAVLDGQGRSARVIAQTPCVCVEVTRFDFWNTLWAIPPVPFNIARLLANRVRRLSGQLQSMATLDAQTRIARQVVTLALQHGQPRGENELYIPFAISQIELAQMVGATRVQVNRVLAAWKKEQILTFSRSHISIHQLHKLQVAAGLE